MADLDLCGRTLGDYLLRAKIGEGGWGVVYRAEQQSLKREVVVKVLHRERTASGSVDRFMREAQLASHLDHPYAAHVYAFGVVEDEELWWIAMELVKGVTLADWLDAHGPMPLDRFVQFFDCVAEVVNEAHKKGIVHRDLKPDNMMVIEHGGRYFPKLLDFGIAKADSDLLDDDEDIEGRIATTPDRPTPRQNVVRTKTAPPRELTKSGVGFGSGPYTAPEQWGNAATVGPEADIYSLGVVIYEVLSGRRPFTANTGAEYRQLHRHATPPPIGPTAPSLWFGVAKNIDEVLRSALSKYPAQRQGDVLELADDLRTVLRTSDREQLRAAAQQWRDRDFMPGMLWDSDVLAEVEVAASAAAEGDFGQLECSFVVASQRRARRRVWRRRALVALVPILAVGTLLYRTVMQERMADRLAIAAEVEQGRQALLHSESSEAVRHLEQAYERSDHSPGVAFMLARALQPRMSELARLESGSGRMWSAMFTPDGKRVLTTDDKAARMWDAASGQLLFTMSHGDTVYGAAFSSDGSKIITAGGDGTVRTWVAATGAPIREMRYQGPGAKKWRYYALAVSSHDVAAIDITGKTVHVWDTETGIQIATLDNDAAEMALLSFSADGHWLATSGRDEVRVFDTTTWHQAATITGPRVHSLSFDPIRPRLAVGTRDGVASLWDIPSGALVRCLRGAGAPVDAIAFSHDGMLVATASRDGLEQVWDAASGAQQTQLNSHHDMIYALEFSSTDDLLLSAGADGAVTVSNVATGTLIVRLEGPRGRVIAAHFDPESHRAVGASWDGTARVWDVAPPYRRWGSPQISADCDTIDSLIPDQRFIALSCRNQGTHVWDTARGALLAQLPEVSIVEGDYFSALPAVTSNGDRAAIARGNTVEVYALPSGQLLRTIMHPAAVNAVAFAPAGHDLVSGAVDGSLLFTHGDDGPIALPVSAAGIDVAAIIADGRVVVADASERLRVIDPGSGAVLMDIAAQTRMRLLRPSPDGTRLVTISTRKEQAPPELWDLDQRRHAARLDGHVGRVWTARFVSENGREILTAGSDGTVQLWDASTGRPHGTFRGDSHSLLDAALSSDGSMIVAGGSDGLLRFWDTSNGRLLWTLQAHSSSAIGVHWEGNELVTRGRVGDVARWTLAQPNEVIEACHARTCTPAPMTGK